MRKLWNLEIVISVVEFSSIFLLHVLWLEHKTWLSEILSTYLQFVLLSVLLWSPIDLNFLFGSQILVYLPNQTCLSWTKLEAKYVIKTFPNKCYLLKLLFSFKMNFSVDLEENLNRFTKLTQNLANFDEIFLKIIWL